VDDLAVGQLVQTGIAKCKQTNERGALMDCAILDGDHTSDPRYGVKNIVRCVVYSVCVLCSVFCVLCVIPWSSTMHK